MKARKDSQLPLAIASDHGGVKLKGYLVELLRGWNEEVVDLGTDGSDPVDYPEFAAKVAEGIVAGRFRLGVLVCGSGIGMSITANRFPGVRAALCTSAYLARMARAHNDANVICLGERVIGFGQAEEVLKTFLEQEFEGGRHLRRIQKIDSIAASGNR